MHGIVLPCSTVCCRGLQCIDSVYGLDWIALQVVTKRPIEWEHNSEPYAFMGDNRWPAQSDSLVFVQGL